LENIEKGITMKTNNGLTFNAPAKWEQNVLSHSPGHLQILDNAVEFIPHRIMSIVERHVTIPIEEIDSLRIGDNFLWRGAVHIALKQPINNREKYIFFLGGKRKIFIATFKQLSKVENNSLQKM
jgi:hypothetical protein